jgi:hypothetical protein
LFCYFFESVGYNVVGRGARRETERLYSDNEAGGRNGKAKIKLKELKHEECHIALGK